jgi:hypothetical protein
MLTAGSLRAVRGVAARPVVEKAAVTRNGSASAGPDSGVDNMNPLEQPGIPVEDQFRNWSELNVRPFDKNTVEPYTRSRVILMNGIEVESIMFSHQFARHTDNVEIKKALALSRRVDAQQQ